MHYHMLKKPVLCWLFLFFSALFLLSCNSNSNSSQDKSKDKVRIITLSPHLAELAVSAGALQNLVGVVSYSDFPKEVTNIKKVGDAFKLDFETIISLKPDYVLTWKGGTPIALLEKLKSLNIMIVETSINTLLDIPTTIEQIAQLTNTQGVAQTTINRFNNTLKKLQSQQHPKLTSFIETYHQPLYTVSGKHWMSEAAKICGYHNIFANLSSPSATVTLESVILKNPQSILVINKQEDKQWHKWQNLDAVKNNKIITINPDIFSRPSMRILQGIEELCTSNY